MTDKKTILIVEDEQAMLTALSLKLQKKFNVLTAEDGEIGVAVAMEKHPDLIIMDIMMPKLNGMDAVSKIREDAEWGFDVPIIMLTNLNDPLLVADAARFKVYDFLVKTDWNLSEIVDFVQDRINKIPEPLEDDE